MEINPSRILNRFKHVSAGSIWMGLPMLGNMLVSWLVVKRSGAHLWGEVVEIQLVFVLLMTLCTWGSKEYLQRDFSLRPALIRSSWQNSLASRSMILLPSFLIIALTGFSLEVKLHLAAWLLMRHIYQSLESLVNYERSYLAGAAAEFLALIIGLSYLYIQPSIQAEQVFWSLSLAHAARLCVGLLLWHKWFIPLSGTPSKSLLWSSAGFMWLSLSGLVHNRLELFFSDIFLGKEALARLQIIMSFLLFAHILSGWMFQPFLKNYYRLGKAQQSRMARNFFLAGVPLCLAGIILTTIIVRLAYGFPFPLPTAAAGFAFMLAPFLYAPASYKLYKKDRPNTLIVVNTGGIISLIILYWLMGELFTPSIFSILLISAVHRYILSAAFIYFAKKSPDAS